ncbi:MAG TPA: exodeoxyribonuclease V subunit gamma, partial [Spirochaetota bacterium]|nr:exodeoxyribonuclease V subunit gamma [Spirochaetota bacterium]
DFLNVPDDLPPHLKSEKEVMRDLVRDLKRLDIFDKISQKKDFFSTDYLIEFVKVNLENIESTVGRYLTDGVTVSSLMPLRPIPFKIVYVTGLAEGEFPGTQENSNIDLRNIKRYVGDISKPEANKYLFLETIMSAKSKIYFTYVGKDIQKDQIFFPNSLLVELKSYLNENILLQPFNEIEIPICDYSESYFLKKEEYSDILVNYDYNSTLLGLFRLLTKNPALFNKKQINEINRRFKNEKDKTLINLEKNIQIDEESDVLIYVDDLAKFLETPLKAKLKRYLGIYNFSDEDYSLKEDEPFYSSFPIDYKLTRDVLTRFLKKSIEDESNIENTQDNSLFFDYFSEYYKRETLKSAVPQNDFSITDKINLWDSIKNRISKDEASIFGFVDKIKKEGFVYLDKIIQYEISFNRGNKKVCLLEKAATDRFIFAKENTVKSLVITNSKSDNGSIPKQIINSFLYALSYFVQDKNIKKEESVNIEIFVSFKDKRELSLFSYSFVKVEIYEYLEKLSDYFLHSEIYYEPDFSIVKKIFRTLSKEKKIAIKDIILEDEDFIFHNCDITDLIKKELRDDIEEVIKDKYH